MKMDTWKFYDITHREHVWCNPMSRSKFGKLLELLRLERGARVLDIASGKGEFLVRLAELYDVSGTGVDISPFCVRDAREKLAGRAPGGRVSFVEMDGAAYRPEEGETFDCAACLGASWIFGDHKKTLSALEKWVRPGGYVIAGEPFWMKEPAKEYLIAEKCERSAFGTHYENVRTGEELGLTFLYSLVSNQDDWDRYESLQWYAAGNYARENPGDPDVPELLERVSRFKEIYLKWGRDTLGWAVYLFRKPGK